MFMYLQKLKAPKALTKVVLSPPPVDSGPQVAMATCPEDMAQRKVLDLKRW